MCLFPGVFVLDPTMCTRLAPLAPLLPRAGAGGICGTRVGSVDDEMRSRAGAGGIYAARMHICTVLMGRRSNMTMTESAVRHRARRAGLSLRRSRSRVPEDPAFGTYQLVDADNVIVAHGLQSGYGLSLEQAAAALKE